MPPNRWHDWTGQQLDYLCCLKIHTNLSYSKISEIFADCLDVTVSGDILRYKCNLLKGTLAPSQANRRVSEVGTGSAWSFFKNMPESSPEVQLILQDCDVDQRATRQTTSSSSPHHARQPANVPAAGPSTRRTTRQSAAAATSSGESSSESIHQSSPDPGQSSSSGLFLPVNHAENISPSPDNPNIDRYDWSYAEIQYLCVLSIHARLPARDIANVLSTEFVTHISEEDVEAQIDKLSVEEYGEWELWGAKSIDDADVSRMLSDCGA
ncbi:MAG: hypothetical protein M1830_000090 [Pleopsidium flavum]|nr:MAG: hypothetical protein M1830_000090 [Pleopsidium flavum]